MVRRQEHLAAAQGRKDLTGASIKGRSFFVLKESSPVGGPLNKKYPLEASMMRQMVVKRGQYRSLLQIHHH